MLNLDDRIKKQDDASSIAELTCRTKTGMFYLPPRAWEMRTAFKAAKLDCSKADIVADMVNLLSDDGGYTSLEEDLTEANKWATDNLKPVSANGKYCTGPEHEFDNKEEAIAQLTSERCRYHSNVRGLFAELIEDGTLRTIPGGSPLKKSINLVQLLVSGGLDENLKNNALSADAIATKIADALKRAKTMDKETQSLFNYDVECDVQHSDGGGETKELKQMQIACDMLSGRGVMDRIARNLRSLSRLQISRAKKRESDPAGKFRRTQFIKDYSEIKNLVSTEWAMPQQVRDYRIATGKALVHEQVRETDYKQLIYMIVDCSGSMRGHRTYVAGGCVMHGLTGVIKGDAELYVRFFDTKLHKEMVAKNEIEAKDVMQKVIKESYSGGGTEITYCAREAVKRIRHIVEHDKLVKPDLLIVSDGEDDVSDLSEADFGGIRLHAFMCKTRRDQLLHLAVKLGGVGLKLD